MNLGRPHRQSLRPLPAMVWLLTLMVFTTLASSAQCKSRKKTKHRKRQSAVAAALPTGPNFDLRDWLHEARLSTRSTSIGQANRGHLHRGEKMDLKGRAWRFLPATAQRATQHGTLPLIRLLHNVGDSVATSFPGSIIELGNVGLANGGPITQSKSHQAGRDVDIVFFALDAKGRSRSTGRMLKFDADLKAGRYTLDLERNWALVKALVESKEPVVQWAFVAGHIRKALLEYARQQKEPNKIIRLASAIMHQPGDSSAHADHMHVRIFCSDWDRACGCRDYGPDRSTIVRDNSLLDERLERLNRLARKGLTKERLSALEALVQLPEANLASLVDDLLCNFDPAVVSRALRLAPRVHGGKADEAIARKLQCAPNPDSLYVLFKPVATYQHKSVWKAARKVVSGDACLDPTSAPGPTETHLAELCGLATRALGYSRTLKDGLLLAPLLESKSRVVKRGALKGLQNLYVTREPISPAADEVPEEGTREARWSQFVKRHHQEKWATQAVAQMQRQGFVVDQRLTRKRNTTELLRALQAGDPLSFTAQIALARAYNVEWLRPLKSKAAHARLSAILPAATEADAPESPPTADTAKNRKLPDLPILD